MKQHSNSVDGEEKKQGLTGLKSYKSETEYRISDYNSDSEPSDEDLGEKDMKQLEKQIFQRVKLINELKKNSIELQKKIKQQYDCNDCKEEFKEKDSF